MPFIHTSNTSSLIKEAQHSLIHTKKCLFCWPDIKEQSLRRVTESCLSLQHHWFYWQCCMSFLQMRICQLNIDYCISATSILEVQLKSKWQPKQKQPHQQSLQEQLSLPEYRRWWRQSPGSLLRTVWVSKPGSRPLCLSCQGMLTPGCIPVVPKLQC